MVKSSKYLNKILFEAKTTILDFDLLSNLMLSICKLTFDNGGNDSMDALELSISCVILPTFEEGVRLVRSVLYEECHWIHHNSLSEMSITI